MKRDSRSAEAPPLFGDVQIFFRRYVIFSFFLFLPPQLPSPAIVYGVRPVRAPPFPTPYRANAVGGWKHSSIFC
ncbi:hypothetical protein CEXT_697421 [Caerostris extrusa]|uniref:Uncharacterized protein n=1 Tax=Caerostris extrusa TaxID=172846 RepID=A0AAV4SYE4_CAEEX|nr:hypothetical protein CEXT_697421 [Caerostris extrusa]